ncbi:outer membrane beta-barrel protein [Sphingomonas naphthae]|uniref:Outer membrane beta-barrel protein n=1 Tax=Sphingomonas naphthae TaxID=1813468 RepID=A0ABY7TPK8_9SPHN|nr:outer membrane beta-barrel protein [Sphingomonas naphthae]WCT74916.1 outer membrane beta-barrel protein [Sphingomonas naphthae]
MKSFVVGGLLAVTLSAATPAFAQDSASASSWTGPYAGMRLGFSWQPKDRNETLIFDTNRDGTFNDTVRTTTGANAFSPGFCGGVGHTSLPANGCQGDAGGTEIAGVLGFDYQIGSNIVVGALVDYGRSGVTDGVSGFSTTPANYTFSRTLRGQGSLRARAGYAVAIFDAEPTTLAYATGGLAYGRVRNRFGTTNGANAFIDPKGDDARLNQARDNVWGYTYGGGVEQRIGKFSIGVLYLYTSLKDNDYVVDVQRGAAPVTNPFLLTNATGTFMKRSYSDFNRHSVSVTTSYRF